MKYDTKLTLKSEDGKTALMFINGGKRGYRVGLAEWPASRKYNVLLDDSNCTPFVKGWVRAYTCTALLGLRIKATFGQPFEVELKCSSAEHERMAGFIKRDAEWAKRCRGSNYEADMGGQPCVIVDPCYLPEAYKAKAQQVEHVGTVFDIFKLACGGYVWRTFGDGPGIDSGTLCILPLSEVRGMKPDGDSLEVPRVDRIEWGSHKSKRGGKRLHVRVHTPGGVLRLWLDESASKF